MRPSFNTSGPCVPGEHYMLPPERRLGETMELIEEGRYFSLQAGRQTGKTTSARWLVRHYNAGDRLRALWVDLETAREEPAPVAAFETILDELELSISLTLPDLAAPRDRAAPRNPKTAIFDALSSLAARCDRPLVLFFDEADGLVGEAMVSFLTQLRAGYIKRPEAPFPHSIILVGMRALRDYALTMEERRGISWLGTTSPFNVSAAAQHLPAFTAAEVDELLAQHTAATGQRFLPEAAARTFELSQGHPWLVNALADEAVRHGVRDRALPVTAGHVDAAKETIILDRRTHIDSLLARLHEPRVRRILDPMLAGDRVVGDALDDDFAYVSALGLIQLVDGAYAVANPIYREVIPRALTFSQQAQIAATPRAFAREDGSLDVRALLEAWQTFWREDGHLAAEGFGYRESGPHLMLMAFLQRVVNGGGRVEREYGLGRGALGLMIVWGRERYAIEVKLRRDTETEERALGQVTRYLEAAGLAEGWLVVFDLRSTVPWGERLTNRVVEVGGKRVSVVGC
jgi:AAA-like domain